MFARMPRETLGTRLRTARQRAGLTLEQVGRHVGVSPQAVQQWEKDRTEPSAERLNTIAQLTAVNIQWLLTGLVVSGVTDQEHSSYGSISRGGRVVPMLSLSQAMSEPIQRDSADKVHTHFPCSKNAFALPVFDRSNSPAFEIGDNVVIDPDVRPVPGDMVLAVVSGHPIFAKYTLRAPRVAELQPLNADWPSVTLEDDARLIGVMTEHARGRRV